MIKAILFDLDGTLLPLKQEVFVKTYLDMLGEKLSKYGYEPKSLLQTVWAGINAMVKNDGTITNEEAYWNKFCEIYGEKALQDKPYFDEFYEKYFDDVKVSCGYTPKSRQLIDKVQNKGYKVVLATSPLFPSIATQKRINWAGLKPDDFVLFTTYENSCYCKPNTDYYLDIANKIGVRPEECLMIGNDVDEDMVAQNIGMKVFLLTDCLLNKHQKDISSFPQGGFEELNQFIDNLDKN